MEISALFRRCPGTHVHTTRNVDNESLYLHEVVHPPCSVPLVFYTHIAAEKREQHVKNEHDGMIWNSRKLMKTPMYMRVNDIVLHDSCHLLPSPLLLERLLPPTTRSFAPAVADICMCRYNPGPTRQSGSLHRPGYGHHRPQLRHFR